MEEGRSEMGNSLILYSISKYFLNDRFQKSFKKFIPPWRSILKLF